MKLKNPKAKGARTELAARDILVASGHYVIKAGGSLGEADLVALQPETGAVRLIQVKSNRPPGPEERNALHKLASGIFKGNWTVEIWVKKDRQPWKITVVDPPPG